MNTIKPGESKALLDPRLTTGQPGHTTDRTTDNPSGLRIALTIKGQDSDELLMVPIEMVASIVDAAWRFTMQYERVNPTGSYEHILKPLTQTKFNTRARAGSLADATLYESSTLRALITAQRLEDAAADANAA